MSDYGEINLIKIEASDEFWAIMDELVDDGSGFIANRGNRGFAKRMVELLEITTAYFPIPESIGFWEKCGINVYGKCEGTA